MSRTRKYGFDFLKTLSQKIGDLSGFVLMCRELVQNADDENCSGISFHFTPEALIVRNSSIFSDDDFSNISTIGSEGKISKVEKTGRFGVGFVSVFQICDHPIIRSNNIELKIYPENQEALEQDISYENGTEFYFKWAKKNTLVRQGLKRPAISEKDLDSFENEFAQSMVETMLFLRNIKEINVYCLTGREIVAKRKEEGDHWRSIKVYENDTKISESDWMVFETSQTETVNVSGVDRSDAIGVAFPLISDEKEKYSGRVFCTLPTRSPTGLPISANADFAIKSDRSSIVDEGSSPEVEWNMTLIERLGGLYLDAILEARDLVTDKDFSKLLPPENYDNPACEILEGISDAFFEHAQNEKMVKVVNKIENQGNWVLPIDARLLSSDSNPELFSSLSKFGTHLVIKDLQNRWTLMTQHLGTKPFTLRDIPSLLEKNGIKPGQTISDWPQSLQSQEDLKAIWDFVDSELKRKNAPKDFPDIAATLPLCPCENGKLMPFGECIIIKADITDALPLLASNLSIVKPNFKSTYRDFCENLCKVKDWEIFLPFLSGKSSETINEMENAGQINIKKFYDCLKVREQEFRTPTPESRTLAKLNIYPSSGIEQYRSLDDLFLPGDFEDPIGFEIILDTGMLDDMHIGVFKMLGLKELTIINYVKSYLKSYYDDPNLIDGADKRNELLNTIRKCFPLIEADPEAFEIIKSSRCIKCTDGNYHQPSEVYIEFDGLEEVLAKYPRPNEIYGEPITDYWLRFLLDIGANKKPKILDIIRQIRAITALGFRDGFPLIEKIFYYLAKRFPLMDEDELNSLKQVRTIEWLPVDGEDRYELPSNLYLGSLAKLVGRQGALLRFSRENLFGGDFRKHIGLLERPTAATIIKNLQDIRNNKGNPDFFIYRALNNLLEKLTSTEKEILASQDLIFINSDVGFVQGAKVFWGSHPFGTYRFRLPEELREFHKLMSDVMRVKENVLESDFLDVLLEISHKFEQSHLPLSMEDINLINWIYAHFSHCLVSMLEDERQCKEAEWHEYLEDHSVVLTHTGQLKRAEISFFADKEWAVKVFKEKVNDLLVDKDPQTWPFLNAIGVRPLSTVVYVRDFKEPYTISASPLQESLRSKGREKAFKRIIETQKPIYPGHHWRLDSILNMEITECDELEVEFSIDVRGKEITSELQHPESHFDLITSNLYIKENLPAEFKLLETARKLASILNPKVDPSVLCSQIRYAIKPDLDDIELHDLLTCMGIDEIVEQKITSDNWEQEHKGEADSIFDDPDDNEEPQTDDKYREEPEPEKPASTPKKAGLPKPEEKNEFTKENGKSTQDRRKDYFNQKRKQFYQDRFEFEDGQSFPEPPVKQKLTAEEWEEHKEQVMVFYNRQIRNIERRLRRLQDGEESFDIYSEDWEEISKNIRERDGHMCRRCGASLDELQEIGSYLTVHHIVPRKQGGSNWASNLITLCIACHREVEKAPELL